MARLIVEAVSNGKRTANASNALYLVVSVSQQDTGQPVTGLQGENFRATTGAVDASSTIPKAPVNYFTAVSERMWANSKEPSGVYDVAITDNDFSKGANPPAFTAGQNLSFGLQVRRFAPARRGATPDAADFGQTVLSFTMLEGTGLPK